MAARRPKPPTGPITAQPYTARLCPDCGVWIYTAAGPFAEGDRTKTMADTLHYEAEHDPKREPSRVSGVEIVTFPFMSFNEETVEAVYEGRKAVRAR